MSNSNLQNYFTTSKDLKQAATSYFQTQLGFNFSNLKTTNVPVPLQIKGKNYDLQIVFQLTNEEISNSPLEGWTPKVDGVDPQTELKFSKYLVCCYDFGEQSKIPNKSLLASFNRQLSAKFESTSGMPNLIVFRYTVNNKSYITFSVSELREKPNQRTGKYIATKVILLKDVDVENTHRGHSKILDQLNQKYHNFDDFHTKLLSVLDTKVLSDDFYKQVLIRYNNLVSEIMLPTQTNPTENNKKDFALRLVGRLIFCWFLKAKGWVSEDILSSKIPLLTGEGVDSNSYYHQILEPLFFESLNKDPHIRNFENKEKFASVPYLNGGLFEAKADDYYKSEQKDQVDRISHGLKVPNQQIQDIFSLFEEYYFTIDENTSTDQEIGVDPEMMGRIFENFILNRSSTGSFYTPREIVDYMVETSLLETLKNKCQLDFDQNTEKQKLLDWLNLEVLDLENRVRNFQREKVIFSSQVLNTEISISSYLIAKLKGRRFNFLTKDFEDCNPHPESNFDIFNKLINDEFEIKSQFIPLPNVINVKQENGQHQELVIPKIGLVLRISGQDFISIWTIGLNENLILDTIFRVYQPKKISKFQQKNTQSFLELVKYFESINKAHLIKSLLKLYFDQQKIPQVEKYLQTKEFDKISWEDTAFLPSDEPPGPRISGVHEIYAQIIQKNHPLVKQTYKNNNIEGYIYRYIDSFPTNYENQKTKEIVKILQSLKILDPACGSGAFPMGVLQKLTDLKHILEPEKSLYEIKLQILQNSIYGVDLLPIAVEISRLRCWLSLVVDENKNDPKPLPNLEFKFVCANSLVGIEHLDNALGQEEIEEKQNELAQFRLQTFQPAQNKQELAQKWQELTKQLFEAQINSGFYTKGSSTDLTTWNPFNNEASDFFDPEWMFGVAATTVSPLSTSGFDLVIGNPPYVQLQKDGGILGKQFEKLGYQTFAKTGDLYQLFYEKSVELLSKNGISCFITSNKWMRAGYGEKLRKFFLTQTKPLILFDLGGDVFESATVDSNILVCQKK